MKALEATANEIDIRPACMQMFRDIGHPFARVEKRFMTLHLKTFKRASAPLISFDWPICIKRWCSAQVT
jgi:hypothetical protein